MEIPLRRRRKYEDCFLSAILEYEPEIELHRLIWELCGIRDWMQFRHLLLDLYCLQLFLSKYYIYYMYMYYNRNT